MGKGLNLGTKPPVFPPYKNLLSTPFPRGKDWAVNNSNFEAWKAENRQIKDPIAVSYSVVLRSGSALVSRARILLCLKWKIRDCLQSTNGQHLPQRFQKHPARVACATWHQRYFLENEMTTAATMEDLKSIDVGAMGIVFFMPLNSDLKHLFSADLSSSYLPWREVIESKFLKKEETRHTRQ